MKLRHLWAAFHARPFGMPIPPNWFALAAVGLLGALVNPGFWLLGAAAEVAYLTVLARSSRFQQAVDGAAAPPPDPGLRRRELLGRLPLAAQGLQTDLEERAAELVQLLGRDGALGGREDQVAQLCWLHLRLLVALQGLAELDPAVAADLEQRRLRLQGQLAGELPDAAVRGSLEGQLRVVEERLQARREAAARQAFIEAELERIRQQIELAREQALLAGDASGLARSVDLVSGSLGEANRWLADRRDILADLDPLAEAPPAATYFSSTATGVSA